MITYNSGLTLIRWGVSINSRRDLLLYLLVLGFFLLMYALSTSTQSFLNFVSDLPSTSIQEITGNRESSNKYYQAHFRCQGPFKTSTSSLNGLSKANQGVYSFCWIFYLKGGPSLKIEKYRRHLQQLSKFHGVGIAWSTMVDLIYINKPLWKANLVIPTQLKWCKELIKLKWGK